MECVSCHYWWRTPSQEGRTAPEGVIAFTFVTRLLFLGGMVLWVLWKLAEGIARVLAR
jgi:hypothetical protein